MILLSPDAVEDVARLRSLLDQSNPDAAQRALASIWAAIDRLQEFPHAALTVIASALSFLYRAIRVAATSKERR